MVVMIIIAVIVFFVECLFTIKTLEEDLKLLWILIPSSIGIGWMIASGMAEGKYYQPWYLWPFGS